MPQIFDLFKDATKNLESNSIYGKDGIRIATKGVINPPRQAALLASSPTTIGSLIGAQVGGLVKGDANRPDDTIFRNNKFFSKPISLLTGGQRANVREGTDYFVKTQPAPQVLNILPQIIQGASSPVSVATNLAATALKNPTGAINGVKNLANSIKNRKVEPNIYGTRFMQDQGGKTLSSTKKFSKYAPIYSDENINITSVGQINQFIGSVLRGEDSAYKRTDIKSTSRKKPDWSSVNQTLLSQAEWDEDGVEFDKKWKENKITFVKIKTYGGGSTLYLPGTVTGISDDFSPEWSNFRYVGSPFMQYRYVGVERSIKFNLKLYYTDYITKLSMIRNINKLKKLVYPDEKLSVITYGNNKQYQPLGFSPTLIQMSVSGLYENIFGFVEELGFSIEENVSWPTMDRDMEGNKSEPYPSVIDVSFGMKVIPNIGLSQDKEKNWSYNVSFDKYPENVVEKSDVKFENNKKTFLPNQDIFYKAQRFADLLDHYQTPK